MFLSYFFIYFRKGILVANFHFYFSLMFFFSSLYIFCCWLFASANVSLSSSFLFVDSTSVHFALLYYLSTLLLFYILPLPFFFFFFFFPSPIFFEELIYLNACLISKKRSADSVSYNLVDPFLILLFLYCCLRTSQPAGISFFELPDSQDF